MRISSIVLLLIVLITFSCKDNAKVKTEESQIENGRKNTLPPLGQDVYDKMIKECTFIDYIWHELPFSVSQSEKSAVQANVAFISSKGIDAFPSHCKSIGRKSYQINGEIYLDADVYFGPGCSYYIFLKDEKPVYANQMTEEGIAFYTQLFKRALEQGQKIYDSNQQGQ